MQTLFQKSSALRSHTGKTKRVFLVKARVPYVNRQDRATAVQSHAKGRVIVQPQILPKPKYKGFLLHVCSKTVSETTSCITFNSSKLKGLHSHETQVGRPFHFMKFQVPVPGKSHKGIGCHQQQYRQQSFGQHTCTRLGHHHFLLQLERRSFVDELTHQLERKGHGGPNPPRSEERR